jgi:hypothetical protein
LNKAKFPRLSYLLMGDDMLWVKSTVVQIEKIIQKKAIS